ncbi:MAG: OsmC family protein [Gammaproteobacteria bacterium]|nr:MAG: OsmC family protein [Gammaproteobacteria bacterium]
MSEHKATVHWQNPDGGMDHDRYPRDHRWEFEGGPAVEASAAPEYRGGPGRVDPEEAFVAAVAACHMLTFLAVASKKKLVVEAYDDEAVGHLEKNAQGAIAITRVELRPRVRFAAGVTVGAEQLRALHDAAHRNCFIANSVKSVVTVA